MRAGGNLTRISFILARARLFSKCRPRDAIGMCVVMHLRIFHVVMTACSSKIKRTVCICHNTLQTSISA